VGRHGAEPTWAGSTAWRRRCVDRVEVAWRPGATVG
jgi:hypothetical protein